MVKFVNKTYSVVSNVDGIKLNLNELQNANKHNNIVHKHVILTIHGYSVTSEYFSKLAEFLAENNGIDVVTFNQRMHGEHKDGVPFFKDFDDFQADVLQILNFLRTKYETARISVYGHSMGAGLLVQLCLKKGDVLKSLEIRDFVFEAPYLQVHPSERKCYKICSAKMINFVKPSLKLDISKNLKVNPYRAAGVIAFWNLQEYFEKNYKFWDKNEFRTSIHVPVVDNICDTTAIYTWYDSIKGENSELFEYPDAGHNLNKSKDTKSFFENVGNFLKKQGPRQSRKVVCNCLY